MTPAVAAGICTGGILGGFGASAMVLRWFRGARVRQRLRVEVDRDVPRVRSTRTWVVPARARRPIVAMALPITPEAVVVASGATVSATAVGLFVVSGAAAAGVGTVIMLLALVGLCIGAAGRADRLVERALPGVLDGTAAGLRSGASLPRALGEGAANASGPLRADLDQVLARVAAGAPFPEAVEHWTRSRPTAAVRATGAALVIAHTVGGGAARAVDGVAASVRDRLTVQHEATALSVQARSSAGVIVIAPLVFGVITGAADQQTWTFLTSTPVGVACLGSGIVLDLVGGGWMAWLAHRVGKP